MKHEVTAVMLDITVMKALQKQQSLRPEVQYSSKSTAVALEDGRNVDSAK